MNTKDTAKYKASEFIYDLGNTALENGFKADEVWEVQIATAAEKKLIEKNYHPVVATNVPTELLSATFALVKEQLNQTIKAKILTPPDRFEKEPQYEYLVAYIAVRIRR
jgi:predicted nucleotidyltransferase